MLRLMMEPGYYQRAREAARVAVRSALNPSDKQWRDWIGEVRRTDVIGRGGTVARLMIDSPIAYEPTGWDMFMAVPTDRVVAAVNAAAADEKVDTIVLELNCPGGTLSGWSDLKEAIEMAQMKKPVHALVHDGAFSLGMWMASLCDSICATPTAMVGSIGVLIMMYDDSELYADAGVIARPIASDELKAVGRSGVPITDEYIADVRARLVMPDYEAFVADVSANRGMSVEAVKALGSRLFVADEALRVGLIDSIKTAEAFVAELAAGTSENNPRPAMQDGTGSKGAMMDLAQLKKTHPELVTQIEKDAAASVAAEMAAQSAQPATFKELNAEFGADASFVVKAQTDGLTLSAARAQWNAKVTAEQARLRTELETANKRKAELEKLPGAGVEQAVNTGGAAVAAGAGPKTYDDVVKANMTNGMNLGQAHVAAQKSHGELYKAHCAQVGKQLRGE